MKDMHLAVSLIKINKNADPDVTADMDTVLDRMVPWSNSYRHSEGNTATHGKASIMGSSPTVIVENGRLQLGTWQAIYFSNSTGRGAVRFGLRSHRTIIPDRCCVSEDFGTQFV